MYKRALSGMRPTGKLHLGHLTGALQTWVKLQETHECFYMIADWHALTTDYEDTGQLKDNSIEMIADWIACGIDFNKSVIFRQSDVKQHAELFLIFSMIVPLGWLQRCPTYKEQINEMKNKDLSTFGFLGYPVLQAADILIYRADTVPVGEDQAPHVELTREIARRFNSFFELEGKKIFPEPQVYLSISPRLPGIDGRKMSKSYENSILLSDDNKKIEEKVKQMFTDPKKIRINDKGHPEGCVVFAFHKVFSHTWQMLENDCKDGKIGCVECKKNLTSILVELIEPIRTKRTELLKNKKSIEDILEDGRKKATKIAEETMEKVRKAVKMV